MAVTVASAEILPRERHGRYYRTRYLLTLTGTYETGGVAITAANVGLSQLKDLEPGPARLLTEFMVSDYIPATGKVMLGWTGGATGSELDEITNADDVSDFTIRVTAYGF